MLHLFDYFSNMFGPYGHLRANINIIYYWELHSYFYYIFCIKFHLTMDQLEMAHVPCISQATNEGMFFIMEH